MGTKDIVISDWLSDKVRFADLFNGTIFDGKQVIHPEELEVIKGESNIVFRDKNKRTYTMKRFRDIVMRWNNKVDLMVLAGEAQSYVSYVMPVRNMLYDGVAYTDQIKEIDKLHKINENNQNTHKIKSKESKRRNRRVNKGRTGAEFLSGFQKTDYIYPVITLVFYFGNEPWDASLDLYGMFPDTYTDEQMEMLHKYVPNYRINLIDVNNIEDSSKFVSDLKLILELMSFKQDKQKIQNYVDDNKEYFSNMDIISGAALGILLGCQKETTKIVMEKEKGGERDMDMCKALRDMCDESRQEAEDRNNALMFAMLSAGRDEELKLCAKDPVLKEKLYKEFGI